MIHLENFAVHYEQHCAISIDALRLPPGQLIALAGPNGAGKSSMLKALAAALPYEGAVYLDGSNLQDMTLRERAKRISYLPQGREVHWAMRAIDVISLGRLPHQSGFEQNEADRQAIQSAMRITGSEIYAERNVQTLSGGELARVLLARALSVDADVLLCDEPTASLDPYYQHLILKALKEVANQGKLVLVVLHDLSLVVQHCDQVVLVDDQTLQAQGAPREALTPERVQSVFGVQSEILVHAGQPYMVNSL